MTEGVHMCKTVFDKGGQTIPLENVDRAEKSSDGRLRVYMKGTSGPPRPFTLVSADFADEFVNDLKRFHEFKHSS